jgi:hypothetical protein
MEEKTDKSWFAKIESPREALRELRILVIVLYALCVYYLLFAASSRHYFLIALAVGYLVLGFALQKYKSRLVAKIFLFWAIIQICLFIAGLTGIIVANNNLISVLFVLWLAIRLMQSTTALTTPIPPIRDDEWM